MKVRQLVWEALVSVDAPGGGQMLLTPECAIWFQSTGKDPAILIGEHGESAAATEAIEQYLVDAAALVERLIDAGVPKVVCLGLLPHEVLLKILERRKDELLKAA